LKEFQLGFGFEGGLEIFFPEGFGVGLEVSDLVLNGGFFGEQV